MYNTDFVIEFISYFFRREIFEIIFNPSLYLVEAIILYYIPILIAAVQLVITVKHRDIIPATFIFFVSLTFITSIIPGLNYFFISLAVFRLYDLLYETKINNAIS